MFNRSGSDRSNVDRFQRAETAKTIEGQALVRSVLPSGPSVSGFDGNVSVIGRDLKIIGGDITILSAGALQIDAEIQGNIGGVSIVVGENARITGTVAADTVLVKGEVAGAVKGTDVTLQSGSKVDGDITYKTLSIEQGALFDGRVKRSSDPAELKLDVQLTDPMLTGGGSEPAGDNTVGFSTGRRGYGA
ncbi:MAG: polymer-forming cytoskeletal protein [Hyphomicrobiaceae bacterium]